MFEGDYVAFRAQEFRVIQNELKKLNIPDSVTIGYSYAAKCPSMSMDTMPAPARKKCYNHLVDTIEHYKPKLVFSCGKLATNIFHRKIKDSTKLRGRLMDMQMDEGKHKFNIVSTIHPWQVVSEPKNVYLFNKDIENNINEVILGITDKKTIPYHPLFSCENIGEYGQRFLKTSNPVACDLETTGLDFLNDYIHSVAFTEVDVDTGEPISTISYPIFHKDFNGNEGTRLNLMALTKNILKNPNNRKIFQNAIFDLRFLAKAGITDIVNVWDTKLLQHFVNEEVPKSLSDLVYYYFNEEI